MGFGFPCGSRNRVRSGALISTTARCFNQVAASPQGPRVPSHGRRWSADRRNNGGGARGIYVSWNPQGNEAGWRRQKPRPPGVALQRGSLHVVVTRPREETRMGPRPIPPAATRWLPALP